MFSQSGGTKTIYRGTIVEHIDGKILLDAIIPHIKEVKTLSVGSLCAMVFLIIYDKSTMPYQLRSQEIGEDGKPITANDVNAPNKGKIYDRVVLKISILHPGAYLEHYIDITSTQHQKSTTPYQDANAEWRGQEYIHAVLRSESGVSPCPDAIANANYNQTDFGIFRSSLLTQTRKVDTEAPAVFNYLLEQVKKVNKTSLIKATIDILIMDAVSGTPLRDVDPMRLTEMSCRCGALYTTVTAKTGFAAADGHNKNWLVDPPNISMIDFGRGSYLLSLNGINKLMAGLERWLGGQNTYAIGNLWRCLGRGSPTGMGWGEWFLGIGNPGLTVLREENMKRITDDTIKMMRDVLVNFLYELKIGNDLSCTAFLITATPEQTVLKNIHKLFVLTALCGGLFHAIDYGGAVPIQFEALNQIYGNSDFNTFESIIRYVHIDLDKYANNSSHHLMDVCKYMQPLIAEHGFPGPRWSFSATPIGIAGIRDLAAKKLADELEAKRVAALEATGTADKLSTQRHVNFADTQKSSRKSPTPTSRKSPTPTSRKSPTPTPRKSPKRVKIGGRKKCRTNRTKNRRQYRHTRKLRN